MAIILNHVFISTLSLSLCAAAHSKQTKFAAENCTRAAHAYRTTARFDLLAAKYRFVAALEPFSYRCKPKRCAPPKRWPLKKSMVGQTKSPPCHRLPTVHHPLHRSCYFMRSYCIIPTKADLAQLCLVLPNGGSTTETTGKLPQLCHFLTGLSQPFIAKGKETIMSATWADYSSCGLSLTTFPT